VGQDAERRRQRALQALDQRMAEISKTTTVGGTAAVSAGGMVASS
jgi:hypothetical protein